MNGDQPSATGRPGGYGLDVERVIDAPAESIFDAFIALYDSQRPSWVTDSRLDLRPGGRWSVSFQVPDGPAFREERVITALERPRRLAYEMTAVYAGAPPSPPRWKSPSTPCRKAAGYAWPSGAFPRRRPEMTSRRRGRTSSPSWAAACRDRRGGPGQLAQEPKYIASGCQRSAAPWMMKAGPPRPA